MVSHYVNQLSKVKSQKSKVQNYYILLFTCRVSVLAEVDTNESFCAPTHLFMA